MITLSTPLSIALLTALSTPFSIPLSTHFLISLLISLSIAVLIPLSTPLSTPLHRLNLQNDYGCPCRDGDCSIWYPSDSSSDSSSGSSSGSFSDSGPSPVFFSAAANLAQGTGPGITVKAGISAGV
jgi:hypothetical protein